MGRLISNGGKKMTTNNVFNQKFNIAKLVKFSIPSMFMMMVLSLYQCVDGLFVSNYVDTNGLGAINIVYPVIFLGLGIALMIGTGGSALIGKALGEKKQEEANSIFTFIVLFSLLIAVITSTIGSVFIEEILEFLGATGNYYEMAKTYLQIHFYFIVFYYLQNMFQIFFITAGRPKFGLTMTILGGITNIVLDYLFLAVLDFGIEGAAIATGISSLIPSLAGLYCFFISKKSLLKFSKFKIDFVKLKNTLVNGSSELLTNIANSITTLLFNYQFFKYYSYVGVDSITIVLYFQFLVSSMVFGFSTGIAPIISYKFGEGSIIELKQIKKNSFIIFSFLSVVCFAVSLFAIYPAAKVFSGNDIAVYQMTVDNYIYFSFSLLFMGISIFASSYFTAIGDGLTSLFISFLRTLLFLAGSLILLPLIFNEQSLWCATSVAELLGAIVSIILILIKQKRTNM